MKKFLIVLSALFLLVFITGCYTVPPSYDFAVGVEFDREEYTRGDRIELTVDLVNCTGKDYVYYGAYSDFSAYPKLYCKIDGREYIIDPEPIPSTCDTDTHTVKNRESRERVYYFNIPNDAPLGKYRLELSFLHQSWNFSDSIHIKSEDSLSSLFSDDTFTVTSGGQTIAPYVCFTNCEIYDEISDSWNHGCGIGAYGLLNDGIGGSIDDVPALDYCGDIYIDIPDNITPVRITVYEKTNEGYQTAKYEFSKFEQLGELPEGEWFIALHATEQEEYIPKYDRYNTSSNDYIFKLIKK